MNYLPIFLISLFLYRGYIQWNFEFLNKIDMYMRLHGGWRKERRVALRKVTIEESSHFLELLDRTLLGYTYLGE
ncbi:hypothetical protein GPICK_12485 [Geobacter pickeringii]|uniref:Uncharacterized protein n=1 Tax=Geobacter pickeringii TaxID=345632 RepID=A0A0B5BHV7_9BACT|nr:hypothetical protein GPICK_12485 [Geobacter pickeringii]